LDVHKDDDSTAVASNFTGSNWFHRGWTLQELLAPAVVEFYDHEWTFLGTKSGRVASIEKATQIGCTYLINRDALGAASVGTRFSWASARATTRPEDMAYCLLGLFEVHMPLIYGEGTRAFYRLQLEMMQGSSDHTIFAWNPLPEDDFELMGILAPSPRQFRDAAKIKVANLPRMIPVESMYTTYGITNLGMRISLPRLDSSYTGYISLLNCRLDRYNYIGIELEQNPREAVTYGNTRLLRVENSKLVILTRDQVSGHYPYSVHIQAESRLRHAMLNTWTVKIKLDLSRASLSGWRLCDVAVISQDWNCVRWILPTERTGDRTFTVTSNIVYVSFVFRGIISAIVVGVRENRIMLGFISPATGRSLTEYKRAVRCVLESGGLPLDRDYCALLLAPDIEVRVSARKTREKDCILWTTSLEVLD
jgi:hypothetical protein